MARLSGATARHRCGGHALRRCGADPTRVERSHRPAVYGASVGAVLLDTPPHPRTLRRVESPSNGERRVKLTVQYDGAGYYGWQAQPDARTVQSTLEAALSRLTDRTTTVIAAGRTDRGVHATGQVASALVPGRWEPPALARSLNAILPDDVRIARAEQVPADFHARYDAIARRYIYRVGTTDRSRSPFHRRWCWPLDEPLDRDALENAARELVGEHSFEAFAKSGQPQRGTRCTVHRAVWRDWDGFGLEFDIVANRFLHHTVRYLVSTMVDMGAGRRPVEDMHALLDTAPAALNARAARPAAKMSPETEQAAPDAARPHLQTSRPAPPAGLFLVHVYYSPEELERERDSSEDLP